MKNFETRCIIFDNHRPIHLANIHSEDNVVVLEENSFINRDYIPSDGSDNSGIDEEEGEYDEEDDDDNDDGFDDNDQVVSDDYEEEDDDVNMFML